MLWLTHLNVMQFSLLQELPKQQYRKIIIALEISIIWKKVSSKYCSSYVLQH